MTIEKSGLIKCENKKTELLINEIYRINPNTKFNIVGDYITEKKALLLYNAVLKNNKNTMQNNVVYIPIFKM